MQRSALTNVLLSVWPPLEAQSLHDSHFNLIQRSAHTSMLLGAWPPLAAHTTDTKWLLLGSMDTREPKDIVEMI